MLKGVNRLPMTLPLLNRMFEVSNVKFLSVDSRSRPFLALLLLVPAPSIGVLANGILAESNTASLAFIGLAIWVVCKVWIFAFPAIWHIRIDGGERGYSLLPEGSGFRPWIEGLAVGLVLSTTLAIIFLLAMPYIDLNELGASIRGIGLDSWSMFIPAILFWVFINSVIEEYVYRWFITEQSSSFFGNDPMRSGAISVFSFTLHHFVAVALVAPIWVAVLAALAVATGGAAFSWLYHRHSSIWPAWACHAVLDVVVFGGVAWIALVAT
jgi:membrane protease YdiL (CAAX protease family)